MDAMRSYRAHLMELTELYLCMDKQELVRLSPCSEMTPSQLELEAITDS